MCNINVKTQRYRGVIQRLKKNLHNVNIQISRSYANDPNSPRILDLEKRRDILIEQLTKMKSFSKDVSELI